MQRADRMAVEWQAEAIDCDPSDASVRVWVHQVGATHRAIDHSKCTPAVSNRHGDWIAATNGSSATLS